MVYFILGFYVFPLLLNLFVLYKDEDVKTVGDFLESFKEFWGYIILPGFNLLFAVTGIALTISEMLPKVTWWKKFKELKIK
jgi:hypothetical protein